MTKTAATETPRSNLQAYQRLQLALILGLRRQISIAVCDNILLRDRLAERLQKDVEMSPRQRSLVSLDLNLDNPAFLRQIGDWLKQHPEAQSAKIPPTFQILGIEGLTRQPPEVQRHFLRHLQTMARYLPQLNVNLLLWLSRPWFHNIKQSVPQFWQWRTGLFEFRGEVTVPGSLQSAVDLVKQTLYEPEQIEIAERFSPQQKTEATEGAFPLIRLPLLRSSAPQQESNPNQERSPEVLVVPQNPPNLEENGSANEVTTLVLHSIAEIEELEQQSFPPETLAMAYIELGDRYRDRIAAGDTTPETLQTAIQAYERGLYWSEDDLPNTSNLLNDLGNFYWMRSRDRQELQLALGDLEEAIEYYQQAIAQLEEAETSPQQYATIQNNLGAAYSDLARYGDSAANLQRSIRAYEEALNYRSPQTDPLKYGSTQNNLGTAYWHLAQQQEPATHLHAAIAAYQEALAQYQPERESMQWAMIQNNLGTAYWNLSQHEEPEPWLHQAIACYQASLQYRTPESAPAACAATQNNLATAYWHLSLSEELSPVQQQNYLQLSLAAYTAAIAIAEDLSLQNPPVFVNFDLVATHNNLAAIHQQLATDESLSLDSSAQDEHLEAALKAHLNALSVTTLHSESYETTLNHIARLLRLFYQKGGTAGQNRAFALVPAQLLPSLMTRL